MIRMNSSSSSAASLVSIQTGRVKDLRYLTEERGRTLASIGLELCVPGVAARARGGELNGRVGRDDLQKRRVELLLIRHYNDL
jgi:hypothetical protein